MGWTEFADHAFSDCIAPVTNRGVAVIGTCHPGGIRGGRHIYLPVVTPFGGIDGFSAVGVTFKRALVVTGYRRPWLTQGSQLLEIKRLVDATY